MNWKLGFFTLFIAFIVLNCSQTKYIEAERTRTLHPSEINSFHPAMNISIGWIPYEDQKLVQTKKNEWKIVKSEETGTSGNVPTIIVTYDDSDDTLFMDMNLDNALLGKLIKHSIMTQEPISRPFTDYFEKAKCQKCHPDHIDIGLEK